MGCAHHLAVGIIGRMSCTYPSAAGIARPTQKVVAMDYPHPLLSTHDRRSAQALIESAGLRFEQDFEDLVGVFSAGRLAGCGARSGRVLKMLVVDPQFRGEGLLGDIVTELMRQGREAGYDGFFIFTRPATASVFERLSFKPLVAHEKAVLLEHGNGLYRYLRDRAPLMHSGENAAVVINADPFTKGHEYLIERAAQHADTVYVLVSSEGRFVFPLEVRMELARRGVAHVPNAIVTATGPYVVSSATFPVYFLNPADKPDQIRIEIDIDLFGRHIAPAFAVRTRAVGTEPLDPVSRAYSQIMKRRLDQWGIQLLEIERKKIGDLWINTKRVRKALAEGDRRTVAASVPETTLSYLQTPEAARFFRG